MFCHYKYWLSNSSHYMMNDYNDFSMYCGFFYLIIWRFPTMVPQGTMGFNINCLVTWMIWGILEGESSGEHVDRYPGAGGVACLWHVVTTWFQFPPKRVIWILLEFHLRNQRSPWPKVRFSKKKLSSFGFIDPHLLNVGLHGQFLGKKGGNSAGNQRQTANTKPLIYPLVNVYITMENYYFLVGKCGKWTINSHFQ